MFHIGLYMDHCLLVIQPNIHVGDQIDFVLQPILYFGVVRNSKVGDAFTSLSNYPNVIEITLTEAPGGGRTPSLENL